MYFSYCHEESIVSQFRHKFKKTGHKLLTVFLKILFKYEEMAPFSGTIFSSGLIDICCCSGYLGQRAYVGLSQK